MKTYKYSFILILIIALVACDKDDFEILSDNAKPQLFTPSIFNLNETSINNSVPIAINNFSSLSDVSQGVVSRVWTIEDGANYLLPVFERKDSLNLVPFINPNIGKSNGADVIHVYFQQPGETDVILRNTFNKPVSFFGTDAVQKGDLWELTTTVTYDVFDKLNAEASVTNEDGTETFATLTSSQNPNSENTSGFNTVSIEAGSKLVFNDLTTIGRPEGRVWAFEGGTPATSTETTQAVSFNRLGIYTVNITTTRDRRGNSLNAEEQTKTIPLAITVIPSTQPYEIAGNAQAIDNGDDVQGTNIISFSVNGEVESFAGSEGDFTVNVTNTGFNQNFDVTSVNLNSSDATIVELILSEPIRNSDTVMLSYNGSTITSVDSRTLNAFSNVLVNAVNANLLSNASNPSFENSADRDRGANAQGYNLFIGGAGNNGDLNNIRNTDGTLFLDRSTERASKGDASLKFNAELPMDVPFLSIANSLISNSNIPAGDYKLRFDVFIEDGSAFNGIFTAVTQGTPRGLLVPINAPGTGEWFPVERNFNAGSPLGGNLVLNFRNSDNVGITGRQVIYIDNLQIIDLEIR
ncbi:hypothetical protein [uncultured Algibacter sp.]|uniref:hypothetical protein n=1 Tax=uncultured Algibacter sp. TaxID=298659 RepID=UPI00321710C0